MKRLLTALALALVILAGCGDDGRTGGCEWAEQRRAAECPMNVENVWQDSR